jgi:hypothetical protein
MKILTRLFCLFICTQFSFAQIEVSPSTLDFGNVLINTTNTQSFSISSTLLQTLTIISPEGFFTDIESYELDDGESLEVNVIFSPTQVVDYSGIIIVSGTTFGDATISLSGFGVDEISGPIAGTLTIDNSPYTLSEDIYIDANTELTIEPGVEIILNNSSNIIVSGNLIVNGTKNDSIIFRSEDGGAIIFNNGSTSIFSYSKIMDLGKTIYYEGFEDGENWQGDQGYFDLDTEDGNYSLKINRGQSITTDSFIATDECILNLKYKISSQTGGYTEFRLNINQNGWNEIFQSETSTSYNWTYEEIDISNSVSDGDVVQFQVYSHNSTTYGCNNNWCTYDQVTYIDELLIGKNPVNINDCDVTVNNSNIKGNYGFSACSIYGTSSFILNHSHISTNSFNGVFVHENSLITLNNTLIIDNGNNGIYSNGILNINYSNIINNGHIGLFLNNNSSSEINNSIIFGNPETINGTSWIGNYNHISFNTNDPLFSDSLLYTLSIDSPCIDAANPDDEDMYMPPGLGNVRADMGAYGGPNNFGWGGTPIPTGEPVIDTIVDLPQDQGGFIGIQYSGSYFDYSIGGYDITNYSFWRELDVDGTPEASNNPNQSNILLISRDEYWEYIGEMVAQGFESYGYSAPTLADSTASGMFLSTFLVIAHTDDDDIFFTSDPASGYSVDNLAPTIPQQFSAGNNGVDQVTLSWEYETEDDFSHHEFNSLWNNTQSVTDSFYVSSFTEAYDEYYLHSIDVNGNISDASPITSVHRFSEGANLVSFNSLPNQAPPSTILGDISYGIIGEGTATSNIDGTWVGSLTNMNQCDGYWVFTDNDAIQAITGTKANCEYSLHEGANLKGYPCEHPVQVINAIDDACISGLIGEGVAVINIDDNWYGSLQSLYPGDAYWISSGCELPEFSFDCSEPALERQVVFTQKTPEGMDYNQSTQQAFYFIEDVKLKNSSIELGDWILAYHNETLVGARMWSGEYTDIPVMGTDGNTQTQNYISKGEIPVFKVMSAEGDMQELTGELKPWSTGDLNIVSTLSTGDYLPHQYRLSTIYPNPFNPSTTINFELPTTSEVKVAIYNLQGSEVTTLLDAEYDAGYHSIVWDASEYASGVYFVKMISTNYIDSRKIMLVK